MAKKPFHIYTHWCDFAQTMHQETCKLTPFDWVLLFIENKCCLSTLVSLFLRKIEVLGRCSYQKACFFLIWSKTSLKIAENLKYTLMIRLGSRSYPLSISRVLRLFGHVSNLYIYIWSSKHRSQLQAWWLQFIWGQVIACEIKKAHYFSPSFPLKEDVSSAWQH